jgi:CBS domain-containing protein
MSRCHEDERAVDAITELSAPRANRALVVDDGLLAGLLSITDLARALEVGRRRPKHRAIEADRRLSAVRSANGRRGNVPKTYP